MDIVGGGCPILNELQVKIRTVTECSKAVILIIYILMTIFVIFRSLGWVCRAKCQFCSFGVLSQPPEQSVVPFKTLGIKRMAYRTLLANWLSKQQAFLTSPTAGSVEDPHNVKPSPGFHPYCPQVVGK